MIKKHWVICIYIYIYSNGLEWIKDVDWHDRKNKKGWMGSYAVAPFVQWNLNNWIWQVASFIPQNYGANPNFSKIQIRHLVGFTFKKGTIILGSWLSCDCCGPGLGTPICQPWLMTGVADLLCLLIISSYCRWVYKQPTQNCNLGLPPCVQLWIFVYVPSTLETTIITKPKWIRWWPSLCEHPQEQFSPPRGIPWGTTTRCAKNGNLH